VSALKFVDLGAVHEELGDELEAALLRVVREQRFVGGEEIAGFERDFADWLGAREVVGVGNGTDAIELVLRALGVGAGDEVLVPANTFIATAEAVAATGARARFVDVDPASGLVDLGSCEERVGPATKAVIPVHLYGRMCDMQAVGAFAREHGLRVIEDAAQAHGAQRDGAMAGTAADAGCFSFYPGKNLGAFGDAGAIATTGGEVAERVRLMRDHGRRGRDRHDVVGRNSRMDTVQAAVLAAKLPHLERFNAGRRRVAERYRELLPAELLDFDGGPEGAESHHLFPVLVDDRDGLAAALRARGIPTGVHYRTALTRTGAFGDGADPCPVAEERADRQLSLPIHPHLSDDDVALVAGAVAELAVPAPIS
jgi:dTDP-4-amino-4,6-dideoxygalactose transaminase